MSMTAETHRRIQKRIDRFKEILIKVSGSKDWISAVNWLQSVFTTKPEITVPARHLAQSLAPSQHLTVQPNSVDARMLGEILAFISSEQSLRSIASSVPEEDAKKVELALREVTDRILPELRASMLSTAKRMPQRRGGGRPKEEVDDAKAKRICEEITALFEKGVNIGDAQGRIAAKSGFTRRKIRQIWESRNKGIQPVSHCKY